MDPDTPWTPAGDGARDRDRQAARRGEVATRVPRGGDSRRAHALQRGHTRRPGSGRGRRASSGRAGRLWRGALALAHGGPLGFRAERVPRWLRHRCGYRPATALDTVLEAPPKTTPTALPLALQAPRQAALGARAREHGPLLRAGLPRDPDVRRGPVGAHQDAREQDTGNLRGARASLAAR